MTLARFLPRTAPVVRNYAKNVELPKVTLNDLPTPEGSWYAGNNVRQRAHNLNLALGIGGLIFTLGFGIAANLYELRNELPEIGEPVDCYKDA